MPRHPDNCVLKRIDPAEFHDYQILAERLKSTYEDRLEKAKITRKQVKILQIEVKGLREYIREISQKNSQLTKTTYGFSKSELKIFRNLKKDLTVTSLDIEYLESSLRNLTLRDKGFIYPDDLSCYSLFKIFP